MSTSADLAIRKILDCATAGNHEGAINALNEYADTRERVETTILTMGEGNLGAMASEMELMSRRIPEPGQISKR